MMDEAVRIEGVSVFAGNGRPLLSGAGLTVYRGERVRVLGGTDGNRALARLIGGLERPSFGQVTVLGRNPGGMSRDEAAKFRGRHIGYVSAADGLWESLTVLENAAMPLAVRGLPDEEGEAAALGALEAAGLSYAAHAYPKSLTAAERRLAALARAVSPGPEILLLDGAMAGLNENGAERFSDALCRLWEKERFTVLVFTGDAGREIQTERTVFMEQGKIRGNRE